MTVGDQEQCYFCSATNTSISITFLLNLLYTRGGGPKITRNFFLDARGAALQRPRGKVCRVRVIFFSSASVSVFVDISMTDLKERRFCIRNFFLLGKTAAQTITVPREAFKEEPLGQARVYERFCRFKRGDMSLEDQSGPIWASFNMQN